MLRVRGNSSGHHAGNPDTAASHRKVADPCLVHVHSQASTPAAGHDARSLVGGQALGRSGSVAWSRFSLLVTARLMRHRQTHAVTASKAEKITHMAGSMSA